MQVDEYTRSYAMPKHTREYVVRLSNGGIYHSLILFDEETCSWLSPPFPGDFGLFVVKDERMNFLQKNMVIIKLYGMDDTSYEKRVDTPEEARQVLSDLTYLEPIEMPYLKSIGFSSV